MFSQKYNIFVIRIVDFAIFKKKDFFCVNICDVDKTYEELFNF